MAVRIAGIQPGYLPWLGYFDQMMRVDAFVIADELPYSSTGWAHRNRVRGPEGPCWLHLPVRPNHGEAICQVRLDAGIPWARKHLTTLRHLYGKGVDAHACVDDLEKRLDPAAEMLVGASVPTIRFLTERLDVRTPLLISSELQLEARYAARFPDRPGPTHRIVAYLEALGATELLEGETGQAFLDLPLFESFGMHATFHRYAHPVYGQLHAPFVSHLSALDLVLCVGADEARHILRSGGLRGDG